MNETDLTIKQLRTGYSQGSFSPLDYWLALEKHIARWEPSIAALYAYDPQEARTQAERSTARWAKREPLGPLDGVPVTLKELIATRGTPVPLGTRASDLSPAVQDAPTAARLREDGAVIFAKTTCPDFGMLSSGLSSFHLLTRNPWDLSQNPGGSSAGAAAAAAAGYGPLHIGTDIGGSVRLPAGWTGIFGFKPSNGRIPIDPFYVGRCAGPMTRRVEDAAFSMVTLTRPDWRDAMSLPYADIDWNDLAVDLSGLRVGLMLDAGCGLSVDSEILSAVEKAGRVFAAAGAKVFPVGPVLSRQMIDGLDRYWRCRFRASILEMPEERQALILPYIFRWAEGAASITGVEAVRGFDQTMAMRKAAAALFQSVDVVLSPTNPVVSYPAEWASPTNAPDRPFEHIAFTVPWNMSEQPAASVNCGFSASGMPIGLQIIGARFSDLHVLKLSHFFEQETGGVSDWPQPPVP